MRIREARPPAALELKSAQLTGILVLLNSADTARLLTHIETLFSATPDFFGGDPAVLDCSRFEPEAVGPDWPQLLAALRSRGLYPYAVSRVQPAVAAAARAAGLGVLDSVPAPAARPAEATAEPLAAAPLATELTVNESTVNELTAMAEPLQAELPMDAARVAARVIDKPLRSGQRVYARGGDLIVLAVVNPGAEVIADGSIHVYAPLKGRALAGASGDTAARIFTTRFEAELISIAGVYRTLDAAPDPAVHQRPAHVRLQDASQLILEPL